MMMNTSTFLTAAVIIALISSGCSSDSNQQKDNGNVILGKVELTDGWARPGSKGNTSGAYLTIANGTAEADTLRRISSPAAGKTELHQSYSEGDGVSGMRPAGPQAIKAAQELVLNPGGLHIMLMNLNQDLAVGDSVTINLEFARVGTQSVKLPIQIQQ